MASSTARAPARRPGTAPLRLVRAEIMKVRTTSTWWLFGIGVVVFTALALWTNGVSHHFDLYPQFAGLSAAGRAQALAQAARSHSPAGLVAIAASMLTSGQFGGVLFAMLTGVLLITNETAHQTATTTFLTTPRRAVVILAKLAAAACFGALYWLLSTAINVGVTPVYLHSQHVTTSLTDWAIVRSVLLNLLAYVMWAIFGLGLGVIVRSQVAAIVAGIASYVAGFAAVEIVFHLIYDVYRHGWVLGAPVIAPAVASLVMITPGRAFQHAPPQWAGLLIMTGYGLAFAAIGIALTRRRDVT